MIAETNQDLQYALRTLRKNVGFTGAVSVRVLRKNPGFTPVVVFNCRLVND